jgi:hypothetical protein
MKKGGLVVAMLLVAACAGSGAGTSTAVTTTTQPATTTTGPLHGVVPDRPLIAQGSVEGADYLFVSAAVSLEDAVHAYIIGFRDNQGQVMVMSLGSGESQVTTADPGVDELDLDLQIPGPMPTSVTQMPDGSWAMYGFGVPSATGSTPMVWRAVSDSPVGPWRDASVVYEVGGPGAWDGAWIDFPTVFVTEEGVSMLYEGASDAEPNTSHLGVATSADGINWERPDSPIMSPVQCDDVISIRMPRLLPVEEDWLLGFVGIVGRDEEPPIRVASGQDPLHPKCDSAEVVLSAEDLPSSSGIHSYALVRTGSGPALLLESLDATGSGSAVWLVPLEG